MRYKKLQMLAFLVMLIVIASGCATIVNRNTQSVRITTAPNKANLTYEDSTYVTPAILTVERSKKPIYFDISTDSVSQTVELKPSVERMFIFGNLVWMHAIPFAYAIDLTNPRRFHYGKRHHIDLNDSVTAIRTPRAINIKPFIERKFPEEKGQWGVVVGIPYANWFDIRPDNEWREQSAGFFGLSLGFEYMDRDNRSIRLMGSVLTDFPAPLPVPVFFEGTYDRCSALSLSLTRQHYLNRLVLGYGIIYSYHIYNFYSDFFQDVRLSTNNMGVDLYSGLRLAKYTTIGARYQPTFYKFSSEVDFQYESTFSIEILFRSF